MFTGRRIRDLSFTALRITSRMMAESPSSAKREEKEILISSGRMKGGCDEMPEVQCGE